MSLSTDLVSQFVKITNDSKNAKKESTVYGTTVEYNGEIYVRIDGSDRLTPISTTADVKANERVIVMIKNHTATVTGNMSSPSASKTEVKDIGNSISDFEIIIANKVDTDVFVAEQARIDTLVTDNATIKEKLTAAEGDIDNLQTSTLTITDKMTAAEADIDHLQANKIDVTIADAKYATITELDATNANVHNLESTYADFEVTTTDKLTAIDAEIAKLEAGDISVDTLKATFATVEQLEVEQGRITDLEVEVGDIDTLIFGSATGSTIQTSFANAVIAQLGNAQIKSAMIESISADKITAGDIITNDVRVMSEDGRLLISDETIQISDLARVRVQIGKDASNDYSINIWDAEGNLMFSKGGITDRAIKDAIIRNDMVSDTANIAAHKLDIDSLFEEINGSSNTIRSTKIYLDDQKQTLDVAFTEITTDVSELQGNVSSQGTEIEVLQGQISSKIWQQDITTAVDEVDTKTDTLVTQYNALEQTVDSNSLTIAEHTSQIADKADSVTVTAVSDRVTDIETDLDGFRSTVSTTYATKAQLNDLEIGGRNLLRNTRNPIDGSYWQKGYVIQDEDLNENVFFITRSEANEVTIGTNRIRVTPGETYSISAWLKRTSNVSGIDFWFLTRDEGSTKDFDYAQGYQGLIPTVGTWVRYTWTFTVPATAYEGYFRIDHNGSADGTDATMYYTMVKMEKGDKATDWTPAPEDIATERDMTSVKERMSTAETKIQQNSNSIDLIAADVDMNSTNIASLKLTAESLTSKVSTNEKNLADLTIGGRNLVVGSSAYREDTPFTNTSSGIDGIKVANDMYMPCEIGETYILQCCTDGIWGNHATDGTGTGQTHIFIYLMTEGQTAGQYVNTIALQDDPSKGYTGRRTWTFKVPDNGTAYTKIMFRFDIHSDGNTAYTVNWWDLKVERGTKATDWTPPPEDMASAKEVDSAQESADSAQETANNAESLIKQLSDSISMLVTDGNGTSLMTQTENGWTFSTSEIQAAVDATSEGLDALTNELGSTSGAVSVLQQAVKDLGVLAEYIKIGTYEGEPCIELGESDSEFKLRITNTRIMFMEGSGIPAYFTNQSMHIKKAVIEEELQQGGFVWKVRSNGNMGLVWKGVGS